MADHEGRVGGWGGLRSCLTLPQARPEEGSVQQVEGKAGEKRVRVQGLTWGQSSRCLRGPTRERWERRVSGVSFVSLQLWHTYVSGTWLLRILAHDRWIQVLHLLHSIMARPAKGFMQKHVTRSHESSSEKGEKKNTEISLDTMRNF